MASPNIPEKPAETPTELFHVTDPDSVDSILANGLRANEDGQIFAITDQAIADDVAKYQLGIDTYALFEIDASGVTGSVASDDVGELTARQHRIIVQALIPPQFLTLLDREKVAAKSWTPFQLQCFAAMSLSEEELDTAAKAALAQRKVMLANMARQREKTA